MKSIKYVNKIIAYLLLIFLFPNKLFVFSLESPQSNIVINTSMEVTTSIKHDNSSIPVKKIISNIGIGYALETTKEYPKGESFNNIGSPDDLLINVILCGYPTKSYIDLNLLSEGDAYFATQVAIWCTLGQYDINKLTGDNIRVLKAINNICTESKSITSSTIPNSISVYKATNKIKEIIMVSNSVNAHN